MAIPRFRPSLGMTEFKTGVCFLATTTFVPGGNCDKGCEQIRAFEEEFARLMGRKHAIAVPSARVGFNLLFRALDLKPGTEMVLPAYTHPSVPLMIREMGFDIRWADVSESSFTVTPATIEKGLSENTGVIIPTHLYGFPCNMKKLKKLADDAGAVVIEDCAQACGAGVAGRRVGTFGLAAVYSFGITKNLTALGGGLVLCDDDSLAEFIRSETATYRMLPQGKMIKDIIMAMAMMVVTQRVVFPHLVKPFLVLYRRFTGRDLLDALFAEDVSAMQGLPVTYFNRAHRPMQAVIGRCQLQRLDEMNKQRRTIADEFRNAFAGEKNIGLPEILPGATPVYPTFPVTVPSHRSKLAARLQAEGIDCSEGFIPDCTALSYCGGGESSAPGAAYLADRVLHLPVYPALDEEEIGMIADIVPRVLKNV